MIGCQNGGACIFGDQFSRLRLRLAGEEEIHVYRVDLAGWPAESLQRGLDLLDGGERERFLRMRHPEMQTRFVMVRALLKSLLAQYLGCAAAGVRLIRGAKGKPRLAGTEANQGLVFNVSHTGDLAVVALTRNTALGIDVERIRDILHLNGMAERCLAPIELRQWRSFTAEHRRQRFFAFWCGKEAFLKATGVGISLGLHACVLELEPRLRLLSVPSGCGNPEEWQIEALDLGVSHSACLCYRGPQRTLCIFDAREVVNV